MLSLQKVNTQFISLINSIIPFQKLASPSTQLNEAMFQGNAEVIERLVSEDPTLLEPAYSAILKEKIFSGDLDTVTALLAECPNLLNKPFSDGMLPLHAAVRLKQHSIVQFLVTLGANIQIKDFQKMNALDYAAAAHDPNLIRMLLCPNLVRQLDSASQKINAYNYAGAILIKEQLKKMQSLDLAEFTEEKNCNRCNAEGISSMHVAAARKNIPLLKRMIEKGGDLLKKNRFGIAPADLLFAAAGNVDPLKTQKIQILLGLLSLSSIVASSYVYPAMSQEAVSVFSAGLWLLNVGVDLSLSYQAYLQLSPETVWEKVAYWGTAVGTIPVFTLIQRVPGAKIMWDAWRTSAICKRAFSQLKIAYQNRAYDGLGALKMVGTELLTVGTTAFYAKESFKTLYNLSTEIEKAQTEKNKLELKATLTSCEEELFDDNEALKAALYEKMNLQRKVDSLQQASNEFSRNYEIEKFGLALCNVVEGEGPVSFADISPNYLNLQVAKIIQVQSLASKYGLGNTYSRISSIYSRYLSYLINHANDNVETSDKTKIQLKTYKFSCKP